MSPVIFIAEDNPLLVPMYQAMFRFGGYEVVNETAGDTAIQKLKEMQPKPDAIILDILMPVMDGFEVLERIKKDRTLKNIPVIMLTNLPLDVTTERALQLGAVACLAKTAFETTAVVKTIDDIIKDAKSGAT